MEKILREITSHKCDIKDLLDYVDQNSNSYAVRRLVFDIRELEYYKLFLEYIKSEITIKDGDYQKIINGKIVSMDKESFEYLSSIAYLIREYFTNVSQNNVFSPCDKKYGKNLFVDID